jgi:hypothetical protein
MPRIRTIKPSFWEDVAPLSHEARLLAVGLISLADDDGRFINTHTVIAGYVYPHEEIPPAKLRRWLAEVVDHGMVELYQVGSRQYGWLPKFRKHQVVNRPQASSLPPPDSLNGSRNDSVNSSVNSSVSHSRNDSVSDSVSDSVGEWNGMEGNGREG